MWFRQSAAIGRPAGRLAVPGRPSQARRMLARPLSALTLLLVLAAPAASEQLSGRVVGVADGDTLTLLTDRREQVRIRLAEIGGPKHRQRRGFPVALGARGPRLRPARHRRGGGGGGGGGALQRDDWPRRRRGRRPSKELQKESWEEHRSFATAGAKETPSPPRIPAGRKENRTFPTRPG